MGPEHCSGGDIREDHNTLLFCSGGDTDSGEVWEIDKDTGEKIRYWDLLSFT